MLKLILFRFFICIVIFMILINNNVYVIKNINVITRTINLHKIFYLKLTAYYICLLSIPLNLIIALIFFIHGSSFLEYILDFAFLNITIIYILIIIISKADPTRRHSKGTF